LSSSRLLYLSFSFRFPQTNFLNLPDVIGLEEIQDDTGSTNDGVTGQFWRSDLSFNHQRPGLTASASSTPQMRLKFLPSSLPPSKLLPESLVSISSIFRAVFDAETGSLLLS